MTFPFPASSQFIPLSLIRIKGNQLSDLIPFLVPSHLESSGMCVSCSHTSLTLHTTFEITTALQRRNTENSKQIFPENELRGYSPNPTFMFLWAI
jgi:hypothetical protein